MVSRSRLRVLSALGAIIMVVSTILGCTSSSPAKPAGESGKTGPKMGGTLRFVSDVDPTSLDPHAGQGGGDHKFFWTIYDNLVAYNQQNIPDPSISLAESWDVKDPKTIVFKLRKGIKFHDGTPFDAEAVKWNIERVKDPATKSAARAQILPVQTEEIVDPYTIIFHLDAANSALINLLGDRGGAMISPESAKKYGAQIGRNPVGTGPFKFVEWVQNDHVTVEKNPDYWGKDKDGNKLPYLDKVIIKVIPEATVRLASLEAGDLDLADVNTVEWDRMEKEGKLTYIDFKGSSTQYVRMNIGMAPLDNADFRRALAWSIDRDAFNRAINQGKFVIATSFTSPAQLSYVKDLKNAPGFDLKKAQEYLDKSGVPPASRKLVLSVEPTRMAWAEFLQGSWAKIGINADIKGMASGEITNALYNERTLHSMISHFSIRSDPDGTIREGFHSEGFYNPGHRPNPELDALIDKSVQTYKIDERKVIYRDIEEIMARDVMVIALAYYVQRRAASKRVQNLETLFGAEGKEHFKEIWLSQ